MNGSPQIHRKRVLADRYELLEIAGKGGMGVVWRAWDASVQRAVAIKLVLPAHTDEEQQQRLARLGRERDVLIDLAQHPNIVTLFDVLTDPLGYVMEWLNGFNLEQWLVENPGPQPLHTVASIFGPVLDAVGYAHDRGIVHRDLKSSNIFLQVLGDRATVRVMDYGLARIVEQESNITTGRLIVGTPQYMSPEQVLGNESTAQTDIYSLGVLLFECVTGALPIEARGDSPIPMLVSKINEDLPRAASINPDIPEALDEVIARATRRNPSERFESCEAFADALFAAIPDLPRSARASIHLDTLGKIPETTGEFKRAEPPSGGVVRTVPIVDRELFGETSETSIHHLNDELDDYAHLQEPPDDGDFDHGDAPLAGDYSRVTRAPATTANHADATRNIARDGFFEESTSAFEEYTTQSHKLLPGLRRGHRSRAFMTAGIALGSVLALLLAFALVNVGGSDTPAPTEGELLAVDDAETHGDDLAELTDDGPILARANWQIAGADVSNANVRGAIHTYEQVIEHWNGRRHANVVTAQRSPMRCFYGRQDMPRDELPQESMTRALMGIPNVPIVPQRIVVTSSGRDYVTFVEEGVEGRNATPYRRLIQMAGSNRSGWLVSVEVNEYENSCFDRFGMNMKTWSNLTPNATN